MSNFKLRDIQEDPVKKGVDFFKSKSKTPAVIVAPTAFGKSWVIASICKEIQEPTIVLQPSKELLEQNYNKLILLGEEASIFSASFNTKELGHITYATIGSIIKAASEVKKLGIKNIIIDECDRYPRQSSGQLQTFLKYSGIKHILGLTATPFKLRSYTDIDTGARYSKMIMITQRTRESRLFKDFLHIAPIKEMVDRKYWTPLDYYSDRLDSSMLKYNTTGAEYTADSIQNLFKSKNHNNRVKELIYKAMPHTKSILVSVPSVKDAQDIAKEIPGAYAVWGNMPKDKRSYVVEGFKKLDIPVVIQVNVLTVGFDHPELDCLISARATSSLSWWYQFLGRATRIHPDKTKATVIDLTGTYYKFGRVEDMHFLDTDRGIQLFGTGGVQLTDVPIHNIRIG